MHLTFTTYKGRMASAESEHQKILERTSEEEDGAKSPPGGEVWKGLLAAVLECLASVFSMTSVQLLERSIPDLELNIFRFGVTFLGLSVGLAVRKQMPRIPKSEILGTVLFCVSQNLTATFLYVSVTFIPVSSADALFITSSLVSGIILFRIFWKEEITLRNVSLIVLCTVGVLLIIQPDFLFRKGSQATNNEENNFVYSLLGFILGTASGLCLQIQILAVKRYPFVGEHASEAVFWASVGGSLLSAILMGIFETPVWPKNWFDLSMVLVHSVTLMISCLSSVYASHRISGNIFNVIFSTSVVILLLPQYTVLSSIHPGNRNWMEVVGVVLVMLGASLGTITEFLTCKWRK